jgi:hypothetical protein
VVSTLSDEALRAQIQAQMADPAFRAEFEQTMNGMDAAEWGAVQSGAAAPITLDEAAGTSVLLGGDGATAEDDYRRAARALLESDAAVTTVIMGHTHGPIDGYQNPLDLPDGRTAYYFNSGTWTRHIKEQDRNYSWDEIADQANYTSSNTYIRLDPARDGSYTPTMFNWEG